MADDINTKNKKVNPVLFAYQRKSDDLKMLRSALIEERQRLQSQVSQLQQDMADITAALQKPNE